MATYTAALRLDGRARGIRRSRLDKREFADHDLSAVDSPPTPLVGRLARATGPDTGSRRARAAATGSVARTCDEYCSAARPPTRSSSASKPRRRGSHEFGVP